MTVEGFYAQWKLSCSDTFYTHYYNPSVVTKGGMVLTKEVCSVCYFDENNVDNVEILTRPEVVGKNPLHIFRNCFDVNIKFPTKTWSGDYHQNRERNKQSKMRQLETLVDKENQKGRKRT